MKKYMVSRIELPCGVCGKATDRIDIEFVTRVCSDECCKIMTDEYVKMIKHQKIIK